MGFWDLGFLHLRFWDLGFSRFRVLGSRVQDLGVRAYSVKDLGLRISDETLKIWKHPPKPLKPQALTSLTSPQGLGAKVPEASSGLEFRVKRYCKSLNLKRVSPKTQAQHAKPTPPNPKP